MKNIWISLTCAVAVFAVKYAIDYRYLLSKQPKNGMLPDDFTSFPPGSAWVVALIWGIVVFIIVFALLKIFERIR